MAFEPASRVCGVVREAEPSPTPQLREKVENLTAPAPTKDGRNFLKYGAAEASFGAKNASDVPVTSNQLIALCARSHLVSYGVPTGRANANQKGS